MCIQVVPGHGADGEGDGAALAMEGRPPTMATSSVTSTASVAAEMVGPSSELPPLEPLTPPVPCKASVDDIVEFLGSAEGRRAYRFWAGGTLTNARVLRDYGPEVLEAFEVTHLISG